MTDFEGEMPGFGGELCTAAFQPTTTVDAYSLCVRESDEGYSESIGLLVDLRYQI